VFERCQAFHFQRGLIFIECDDFVERGQRNAALGSAA
jgi:hypothetical protein